MQDFIFTVRNIDNNSFSNEPDKTTYLILQENGDYIPDNGNIKTQAEWLQSLINEANQKAKLINRHGIAPEQQNALFNADILVFIHGYNNDTCSVIKRHRILRDALQNKGWQGVVVSFDWPSSDSAALYLDDRKKARLTAMELVKSGISLLAKQQSNNCKINIHALAHSTGAFVIREAFDQADDANLPAADWMLSQLMFISGDISSASMNIHAKSDAIYNHCTRFTNYQNPNDAVLGISNSKRLGIANRVGRVGLPDNLPSKCVDVNCGDYYKTICEGKDIFYGHSWYFDAGNNSTFIDDLYHNILGNVDRNVMDTRELVGGELKLKVRH